MRELVVYVDNKGISHLTAKDCANADGWFICSNCNATGNEKYEHRIPYPSDYPDSGYVDDKIEIRTRKCSVCSGLGYVKNMPKELDPEYNEYLRLKEKFKG